MGAVRDFLQHAGEDRQGTADETIRVRWLKGPMGRQLVELAGPMDGTGDETGATAPGRAPGRARTPAPPALTAGRTNAEIAAELGP
jgi:hypothetical protein